MTFDDIYIENEESTCTNIHTSPHMSISSCIKSKIIFGECLRFMTNRSTSTKREEIYMLDPSLKPHSDQPEPDRMHRNISDFFAELLLSHLFRHTQMQSIFAP